MSIRIAVVDIRADWPAYAEAAGMRIWAHSFFPCVCCNTPKKDLLLYMKTTLHGEENNDYTQEQYLEDVRRMEKALPFA